MEQGSAFCHLPYTVTINYGSEREFQQIRFWTRCCKIKAFIEQGNLYDKAGIGCKLRIRQSSLSKLLTFHTTGETST